MSSLNKVILIGHLGKDPEVRYTTSGKAVANVSLATNEAWKDKTTGEKTEKTEWHNLVMYDKLAEIAGKWLNKGALTYIEGRIQTRKWQDQNGVDRYTTEIIVNEMKMLSGKGNGDAVPAAQPIAARPPLNPAPGVPATSASLSAAGFNGGIAFDEDIPF